MSPPLKDLSKFLILIVLICKHHGCSNNTMAMQAMNWLEGVTGLDLFPPTTLPHWQSRLPEKLLFLLSLRMLCEKLFPKDL